MYRDRYQTNTNEQTEADGQEQIDSLTEEQRRTHGKEGQGAGRPHKESARPGGKQEKGAPRGLLQVGRGGTVAPTHTPGSGLQSPQFPEGESVEDTPLPRPGAPQPLPRGNPSSGQQLSPAPAAPGWGAGGFRVTGGPRLEEAGCGPRKTSLEEGKRRNWRKKTGQK